MKPAEPFSVLAARLRGELGTLEQEHKQAKQSGDTGLTAMLATRIAQLQSQLDALTERMNAMAQQAWKFSVERDREGYIDSVTARPIA